MQRPKIDPDTATRIRLKMLDCAAKGTDPIRALDELGFLSFPALEQQCRHDTVSAVADLLNASTIDRIAAGLRDPWGQRLRVPATAQDTKDAIVRWLHNIARDLVQPTPEENR